MSIKDLSTQTLQVNSFCYKLEDTLGETIQIGLERKGKDESGKRGYKMHANGYQLVRASGRAWDIPFPIRFYGFPDEAVAYYQNTGFIQDINVIHEKLFSKIFYLGPLRAKAKRLYTWTGRTPESVGVNGSDAIVAILAAKNEKRLYNLSYKGHLRSFDYIVAMMLQKMKLIDEFEIQRISDNRQDYDVKVKTKGSRNFVDIPDVGVGVSQVLPVIVELFYAPPGSTVIMEQPELHLHPGAQAALADVIIDAIYARENGEDRKIQLIVETHSEHFLRRLQFRVAEDKIRNEDFSAYFADSTKVPSTLRKLQVDEFGNIMNWPKDFFGDLDSDIIDQTNIAIEKRLRQY